MPSDRQEAVNESSEDLSCYLSDDERRRLVASLHDTLNWIGVQPPYEIQINMAFLRKEMAQHDLSEKDLPPELHQNKGILDLRNLIWRLVNAKELSEREENEIKELIKILRTKEHQEEEMLKGAKLTCQQAKHLYRETEEIIRSLIDLKDILGKKRAVEYGKDKVIEKKVDEIKRWNDYIEQIQK